MREILGGPAEGGVHRRGVQGGGGTGEGGSEAGVWGRRVLRWVRRMGGPAEEMTKKSKNLSIAEIPKKC